LLPEAGQSLILAGALISIALNPLLFSIIDPVVGWVQPHTKLGRILERSGDTLAELPMTVDQSRLTGHIVLVGYGRVGGRIADALLERGIPVVVAEQNRDMVEQLRKRDILSVSGDASEPAVLIQAHIARAQMLVIAVPDTLQSISMIEIARMLKPGIKILARAHSDQDAELLRREGVDQVYMGEHELALGMTRHVLAQVSAVPDP
jgi:CPA2 family monovalent cation:H+ antiporter-2